MSYNTETNMAALEEAFFRSIDQRGVSREAITCTLQGLEPKAAHLIQNCADALNVRFTLLAVAARIELEKTLPVEEATRYVDEALNGPLRAWVLEGTRTMLDESPDPFAALVASSKEREQTDFGPSFYFERPVDDGQGYLLNIKRCLYNEVLKACGRPDLQPTLCRFDLNWIDALDPKRHKVRFHRPTTFVNSDVCRMWFIRDKADTYGTTQSG